MSNLSNRIIITFDADQVFEDDNGEPTTAFDKIESALSFTEVDATIVQQTEERAQLELAAPDLLIACKAMLDAQSARRHPLGAPDEGIATLCVEAASKASAAIAKAGG
jgi:hypothetical protein